MVETFGLIEKVDWPQTGTMLVRNYRDKREKRCCSGSHKQCKTLFKDHMVRLKIISLYIYKELRLRILGLMSHVTIRSCFSALRPKINHFRIHRKCYFPVKYFVSLICLSLIVDWSQGCQEHHGYAGCDTVSSFADKGKGKALNILLKSTDYVNTFTELGSTCNVANNLMLQLEKFVCELYSSKICTDVNELS